ncbi:restriction endonuclease subunit S [Aliivibrio sp. 1S128]|uniref:restriction endonuclease subunit S n=1 Tax=Aliivibrio sp. 1S128 TaxID=1840085 RepID=UPI00080DCB3D|nr:restriction endonuclease subunit S [Aliivibrio sp. 1S128]OCH11479.1 hypothetical protein A6E03_04215 [Aliivibrio sp. 1S128]
MSKYQAYSEYQDSGIEWLKEIPKDWSIVPLKYLAELTPKKSELEESIMSEKCTFLPMEKLKLNSITLDEIRTVKDVYDGYTYFKNGDVLIAKVTPCFENKNMAIAAGLTNGIGFGSSEIYVLRPNDLINNRFLYYRLQEDNFMAVATGAMTGAGGLKRVPSETVNNFTIAIPTTNDQTQIAAFLDHETAKIDTLIEKQQQLIELLKEKRQAVISHAVTKGLNPDAPMKDSGVEWLGEVPEHWSVKKIKHFGRVIGGFAFKSGDFIKQGYPVVKITNVSHLTMSFNELAYLPETFAHDNSEYIAPPNSLVFAMTRPIIAGGIKVAKMPKLEKMPLINQRVGFLKIEDENLTDYILFSSLSNSFIAQFKNNMTITNQPNISSEGIESVSFPFPPKDELKEITAYLTNNENKFDSLIKKSKEQVHLLTERRTALISAAVTGKIDVRSWVATTSSDTNEAQEEVIA